MVTGGAEAALSHGGETITHAGGGEHSAPEFRARTAESGAVRAAV